MRKDLPVVAFHLTAAHSSNVALLRDSFFSCNAPLLCTPPQESSHIALNCLCCDNLIADETKHKMKFIAGSTVVKLVAV